MTTERRHSSRSHFLKRLAMAAIGLVLVWVAVAYVILPLWWKRYTHRHPGLDDVPGICQTADGIPGDPINVALVGTQEEVVHAMETARWHRADKLGWRSDIRIAEATVLERSYVDAPVSNLYLFGRKQDLAFEQPVGGDPRKRHHVRFWCTKKVDEEGRPVWAGSATFDRAVGFSHTTGQITHHIAADVDAERDHVLATLEKTGGLAERYAIDDFHKVREGKNGGGDPWRTDGKLYVGVIKATSR